MLSTVEVVAIAFVFPWVAYLLAVVLVEWLWE